jgi:multidrug efflux pump subunit AcrA (membrane-fusion protein)
MGSDTQAGIPDRRGLQINHNSTIEATGTLEPVKKSELGFKNDGTIILLNVQPGDHVTEGQILAQQTAPPQTALDQANSSLLQDELSSAVQHYDL